MPDSTKRSDRRASRRTHRDAPRTGAGGAGLWFSIANWDYDGAPATSSPGNTLNGDNPQNELLAEMTYSQAKELPFMQK